MTEQELQRREALIAVRLKAEEKERERRAKPQDDFLKRQDRLLKAALADLTIGT